MPSIRKRIGYLPSPEIQEIITNIANKENLSQSKVVGILVEEALLGRGGYDIEIPNSLITKNSYINKTTANNSSFKFSDIDELISDKGIIYNAKNQNQKSEDFPSQSRESYNEYLLEQFRQFILFQKMKERRKE